MAAAKRKPKQQLVQPAPPVPAEIVEVRTLDMDEVRTSEPFGRPTPWESMRSYRQIMR